MTEQEFITGNRTLIDQVIGERIRINEEEEVLKGLKGQLLGSLVAAGLEGAEDETCKLKIVAETKVSRIDTARIKKTDPALYASLLNTYLKVDPRSGYLYVKGKNQ